MFSSSMAAGWVAEVAPPAALEGTPKAAPRVVVVGEGLLELSHPPGKGAALGYGGDTLNTAVYLARAGHQPHFVSALGVDPYSDGLLKEWDLECVQTGAVLRHPDRMPGLYAIQTDHVGERSFYYWKAGSAACAFWDLPGAEEAMGFACEADWLYFSGITLSLWDEAGRARLAAAAKAVRARGGQVAFDPNYRPRGWPDRAAAQAAVAKVAPHVTIALPTLDDENALHGQSPGRAHADRWLQAGAGRVVMKCGAQGARLYDRDSHEEVPIGRRVNPVDTTGAGDSFNAGFLSAKIEGHTDAEACRRANCLAGAVVQHAGAIIPRSAMPAGPDGS